MEVNIISSDQYFLLVLRQILDDAKTRISACSPALLIIDTASIELLPNLDIHDVKICAAVIFIQSAEEETLLKHIKFIYPIIFILRNESTELITTRVHKLIHSLYNRSFCIGVTNAIQDPLWLTDSEIDAVRKIFMGEEIQSLAASKKINQKTVQNYFSSAMRKLNLKFSAKTYVLFFLFERSINTYKCPLVSSKNENDLCSVRDFFMRVTIMNHYHN